MPETTVTSSNMQKQASKSQFIITQAMLASIYKTNRKALDFTLEEVAIAIFLGCRIEPGPIKPLLETDQQGYQRFSLSEG